MTRAAPRAGLAAFLAACLVATGVLMGALPAQAAPVFKAPFPCGHQWTYSHHSSEVRQALDFVRADGGVTDGTPVLASAAGTAYRHSQPSGAGNYVVIDHGSGWQTYYFHLSAYSVATGASVSQGQQIGLTGNTGNSFGAHIHYEQLYHGVGRTIVINGVSLAPYPGSYHQRYLTSDNCGRFAEPVGGRAFGFGSGQHYVAVGSAGGLASLSWSPESGVVQADWRGGVLTGRAMGYAHAGQRHVFARGRDDTLRHWWFGPGMSVPGLDDWDTVGRVVSDPTGFAYGSQQHVFYRNPDGWLEHRFYDLDTGRVSGGVWPGGRFVGNPFAFVHRDQQHVFGRTASGGLIHWYWWPGISPRTDDWGVRSGVASDPTGFSYGGQHHVFFRDSDGGLGHRFFDDLSGTFGGGVWPGAVFVGNPHAFVHRDQQHVFGRTASGDLVHWYWWPGIDPRVDDWGARGVVTGDPVGLSAAGQHHVFYRLGDGTLEHRFVDDTTGQIVTDNWGGSLAP
ncbi:peptidoglycan DD-metalloendopeptidase family protein [Salinispora arenicola]|uniref:Repeat uncharacterized protein DUF346 n=1 Tax=Salinispora arenicola TaxID=168697 RepID=A0A542XS13_SALAC|nr:peptidoglycan DD-metalloendopeptidase family protein [Salinispora arenicola]TQL38645.1 repeat uncharacterized protein DUF346 [Salinispora arenicola]GIM86674.1 hypothetical protein Sar04_34100 [Salinispora arenicola]